MVYANESMASGSLFTTDELYALRGDDDESSMLDFKEGLRSFSTSIGWSKRFEHLDRDDGKTLDSGNTSETASHQSAEQDPVYRARGRQGPAKFLRSVWNRKQSGSRNTRESKQDEENSSYVAEGRDDEMTTERCDVASHSRGRSRIFDSNSPPTLCKIGATRSRSVDRSQSAAPPRQSPTRARSLKSKKAPFRTPRNIFRGMTRTRKDTIDSTRSSQLRTAVKLKLLMKEKEEREAAEQTKSSSGSFWSSTSRSRPQDTMSKQKNVPRRSTSLDAERRSELPPRPPQKSKSTMQPSQPSNRRDRMTETDRYGSLPVHANHSRKHLSHKAPREGKQPRPSADTFDQTADQSLFDSLVEAWNSKDTKESMADYEDNRLGDINVKPERIRTARRLEIASENEPPCRYEPARPSTDTVSFELTLSSDGSSYGSGDPGSDDDDETDTRDEISVVDSVTDAWEEIVRSAEIISRHYELDLLGETKSVRRRENVIFQNALKTLKGHAKRLKMGERELFAAVREDPSILNDESTYDDDDSTTDHIDGLLVGLGEEIDEGLDRYVEAFEGMLFNGVRCAPTRGRDTPPLPACGPERFSYRDKSCSRSKREWCY